MHAVLGILVIDVRDLYPLVYDYPFSVVDFIRLALQ